MSEQDPNNASAMARMMLQSKIDIEDVNNNLLKNLEKKDNENVS